MKISELKQLVVNFGKTLNNKDKDEWWGTDLEIWRDISVRFVMWAARQPKFQAQDNKISAFKIEVNNKTYISSSIDDVLTEIMVLSESKDPITIQNIEIGEKELNDIKEFNKWM